MFTKGVEIHYQSKEDLQYDNANADKRIFEILLYAQMSYHVKYEVWDLIQKENYNGLRDACTAPEYTALVGAIQELIALKRA